MYKRSWRVEPGTSWNKSSWWSGWDLNLGSPNLKSSALSTGPCCLLPLKGMLKDNSHHHFTFAVTTLGKAEENKFFFSSSNYKGAGMAQWWEHSPPTNVARDRFSDLTQYVGWVCYWFSSLLRKVFLWVFRFSPLPKNQHFEILIQSKFQWTDSHSVQRCPFPLLLQKSELTVDWKKDCNSSSH